MAAEPAINTDCHDIVHVNGIRLDLVQPQNHRTSSTSPGLTQAEVCPAGTRPLRLIALDSRKSCRCTRPVFLPFCPCACCRVQRYRRSAFTCSASLARTGSADAQDGSAADTTRAMIHGDLICHGGNPRWRRLGAPYCWQSGGRLRQPSLG